MWGKTGDNFKLSQVAEHVKPQSALFAKIRLFFVLLATKAPQNALQAPITPFPLSLPAPAAKTPYTPR